MMYMLLIRVYFCNGRIVIFWLEPHRFSLVSVFSDVLLTFDLAMTAVCMAS